MAHGWRRGRNLCVLPLQTPNDYSEIGRLNEDEILMPAVTGVLFKWPAHSSNLWAGLRHGNGSDVGQTRHHRLDSERPAQAVFLTFIKH
jgi:hypothetical protein